MLLRRNVIISVQSFSPEINIMTPDKAIWAEFKFVKGIFQIRIMFYNLRHLLLVEVWVNQVQDPYLTMMLYWDL